MRKHVLAAVGVGVVALSLAGSLALAADKMKVDVPFSFIVNDKELAAGSYQIEAMGNDMSQLSVRGSGGAVLVKVLERLADTGNKEPKLVFDKLEGKYRLSEVLFPGSDGYLVGIAGGKETHEVVTAKP